MECANAFIMECDTVFISFWLELYHSEESEGFIKEKCKSRSSWTEQITYGPFKCNETIAICCRMLQKLVNPYKQTHKNIPARSYFAITGFYCE